MEAKTGGRARRIVLLILGGLLGFCLALSVISALNNRNLPQAETAGKLSELDKARLLEAVHLRANLGDQVWPGWGSAAIPLIVWNDAYEFLADFSGGAPGWEIVPEDELAGRAYFRRAADDPQNFAVPVGDSWAASMGSKSNTDAFLISQFRDRFPPLLKQIFPYRLLIQPSETQIGGLLHESFHVLQKQTAPGRLDEAEAAHRFGDEYDAVAADFAPEFKQESALLARALGAKTRGEKADLVQQFLALRDARRDAFGLTGEMVDYERWLEWEEGVAKYIEVASLKKASETPTYNPLSEMAADPDFRAYRAFNRRWSQEMIQLRYQTTAGESQLYMTGMAEAFLLDGLLPGWKESYWGENVFLEDLLRGAVSQ